MPRVLLVDDDPDFTFAISALLTHQGHDVSVAGRCDTALSEARKSCFDVAFLDLKLPDANGLQLLDQMATVDPLLPIVCLTGSYETGTVVEAMRKGAVDFLTKPVDKAMLFSAVTSAAARRNGSVHSLWGEPSLPVGASATWRRAVEMVSAAAAAPRTTVLITGEPGTGKEVMSSLLHRLSARSNQPLVTVNAGCFTPSLMESELFGHEAGAFTGASRKRKGLFEQADKGILFLDEIGELALDLQGKLLRVLEGHSFRRVGGESPVEVDVRLVAATNRNLSEMVKKGTFRADLLERIRVFEVKLPPLRERREDIERLVNHFVGKLGSEMGVRSPSVTTDATAALVAHHWPGNVRELRNVIERALVLSSGPINLRHLPIEVTQQREPVRLPDSATDASLEEVIRHHIVSVFAATGGNVTHTASRLGMSRLALRKRLQTYGLRPVGL